MLEARLHRNLLLSGLSLGLSLVACSDPAPTAPDGATLAFTSTNGNSPGAKLCYKDGWMALARVDGTGFSGEGDCVSYGAMGALFGQAIQFTSVNPSPVEVGAAGYAPQAVASSGLPVTIGLDAASAGCTLSSGVVSFIAEGTCLIDANQAGDQLWAPAPQAQQAIIVNRKAQTISFLSANPSPVHVGDPDLALLASATSGLAVAFSLDPASTGCSLAAGLVSFTAAGTCLVNADQAGDATWAPAPQVQQSIAITVNPRQYCESTLGGTFGGVTSTALWTCDGWTAQSQNDAEARVEPLVEACRADNGATTGGFDYGWTAPFPTEVHARCHLPV